MKRLRVILLFLLLGAIVNVAVAWGCALMVKINDPPHGYAAGTFISNEENWLLIRVKVFGTQYYSSTRNKIHVDEVELLELKQVSGGQPIENIKPRWGSMDSTTNFYQALHGPTAQDSEVYVYEIRQFQANGWPMLSLWCVLSIEVHYNGYERKAMIPISFLAYGGGKLRSLPLYPIWTGILVNTLFYATLLWLTVPGPFVFRRMIRYRRGLCLKCAYDLRGAEHEACPECGEASPRPHIANCSSHQISRPRGGRPGS